MKKFTILLTSVYIISASAASAAATAVVAGLAVASTLLPPFVSAVKSIAEELKSQDPQAAPVITEVTQSLLENPPEELLKAINETKNIVDGKKCPGFCLEWAAFPCKSAFWLSVCKGVCQKIQMVNGYELKIRFGKNGTSKNKVGEDWDLNKCVRNAVMSGKKTPQGKRERYELLLISDLPKKGEKREKEKIYLEIKDGMLKFNLIARDGKPKTGTIDIAIDEPLTNNKLKEMKFQILQKLFNKGHINFNPMSIAIYDQTQLNDIMGLIGLQKKAELIAETEGKKLTGKKLENEISKIKKQEDIEKLSPEEKQRIVAQNATKLVSIIEETINKKIENGKFGFQ
jgi:hypothetical protein